MTPKIIAKVEALGGMPYGQPVRIPHGKTYRKGEALYWPAWLAYNESRARAIRDNKRAYHWQSPTDQAYSRALADEARGIVLAFIRNHGPVNTTTIRERCQIRSSFEYTLASLQEAGKITCNRSGKFGGAIWRLAK